MTVGKEAILILDSDFMRLCSERLEKMVLFSKHDGSCYYQLNEDGKTYSSERSYMWYDHSFSTEILSELKKNPDLAKHYYLVFVDVSTGKKTVYGSYSPKWFVPVTETHLKLKGCDEEDD